MMRAISYIGGACICVAAGIGAWNGSLTIGEMCWCDEQQDRRGGVVVCVYGRVWWGRSEQEARAKANRATLPMFGARGRSSAPSGPTHRSDSNT